MGYGIKALTLLKEYYESKFPCLSENSLAIQEDIENVEDEEVNLLQESVELKKSLPPLLLKLNERPPEKIDYLGVSYGVTEGLLKFWKRAGKFYIVMKNILKETNSVSYTKTQKLEFRTNQT